MLIVYDVEKPDPTYKYALETIHAMGEVRVYCRID